MRDHRRVAASGGRRDEKRRRTNARLYDEAMRLFRERGFDAVPVGDIARAAGVSVPTFYAHFESKDHLVLGLPTPEQVTTLLAAIPPDVPTIELLRTVMVRALADGGLDARDRILERWRVVAGSPSLLLRAAGFERATAEMVLRALPAERAALPETRVTVTALMSAYTQVLLRWAESEGRRPPEEVVDEVLLELRTLS
jgi:AcrR family transcriptional regulator